MKLKCIGGPLDGHEVDFGRDQVRNFQAPLKERPILSEKTPFIVKDEAVQICAYKRTFIRSDRVDLYFAIPVDSKDAEAIQLLILQHRPA